MTLNDSDGGLDASFISILHSGIGGRHKFGELLDYATGPTFMVAVQKLQRF
jgi:hypothetical protein